MLLCPTENRITANALRHRNRKNRHWIFCFHARFARLYRNGGDKHEVESEMKSAIRFHINGLKEDGLPVPQATSIAEYVEA